MNLSVLDGWWDEGWVGDNGWAIGGRETNPDEGAQDYADAQDLYRLLEQEVVPLYYGRDADDVPAGWTRRDAALDRQHHLAVLDARGCSTSTPSGCTSPAAGSRSGGRPSRPRRRPKPS